MNNLSTNKTNTSPLERKNTPAPVLENPENIEAKDSAFWFENNLAEKQPKGLSATGFMDLLSSTAELKVDTSSIVDENPVAQSSILKPGEWTSFSKTAEKVTNIASKTVNIIGNVASVGKDAGLDLVNQVFGTNQTPEAQTFSDPKKQEEENNKIIENQFVTQKQEEIEVAVLTIHKTLEALAQQKSIRENISNLTGLQMWLEGMITETGEVRVDLQASTESKAKELQNKRNQAISGSIKGTSKQGGQGLETKKVNLANETSGGNTNTTNAVG